MELVTEREFPSLCSVGGKKKKASVALHLLVLLMFLDLNGNACTLEDLGDFFSLGAGTVMDCLDYALAVVLLLKNETVAWPTASEHRAICARIAQRSGFRHCVEYLDGTVFPFEFKPQVPSSEDYFSRKSTYGLNAQVVFDDHCRIRYICCGWPASTHAKRVWLHTAVHIEYASFFSKRGYLLVDSAYKASEFVIPACKKGRCLPLSRNKEYINTALAKLRIKSGYCLGRLEHHFQYLKRIRATLKDTSSKKRILGLIDAAYVLHNILIEDMIPRAWVDEE